MKHKDTISNSRRTGELPYGGHPLAAFLARIRDETVHFYDDRLISLAVFGSTGRGSARSDSDVDLIVVADELPHGRVKRVSEFSLIEDRLQKDLVRLRGTGVHTRLSSVIKSPDEILAGSALFLDMISDALILYDKERFFENYLKDFKKRLAKLGARRVILGDRWYWDLKPDYHVGEVFTI